MVSNKLSFLALALFSTQAALALPHHDGDVKAFSTTADGDASPSVLPTYTGRRGGRGGRGRGRGGRGGDDDGSFTRSADLPESTGSGVAPVTESFSVFPMPTVVPDSNQGSDDGDSDEDTTTTISSTVHMTTTIEEIAQTPPSDNDDGDDSNEDNEDDDPIPTPTPFLGNKPTSAVAPSETSTVPTNGGSSDGIKVPSNWKVGAKWEIVLHNPMQLKSEADVVPSEAEIFDIDLGHACEYTEMIPTLKAAGKTVICYFNAGAVQTWDSDKADFPSEVIGTSLGGAYAGEENYVDIRDERVVEIMKRRIDLANSVGCDAVDPDNVDAWVINGNDPTGFNLQSSDYATYLLALAEYAHTLTTQAGNTMLLGQKNAPEIADQLYGKLDFAVLEECLFGGLGSGAGSTANFCGKFQSYTKNDKPVFQIEYPESASTGAVSDSDYQAYCGTTDGNTGFSEILKVASEQVDGWGQYCDGASAFETPVIADE